MQVEGLHREQGEFLAMEVGGFLVAARDNENNYVLAALPPVV